MCRVYHPKHDDSYVRLCYRFGELRGTRVSFQGEPPVERGHYRRDLRRTHQPPLPLHTDGAPRRK